MNTFKPISIIATFLLVGCATEPELPWYDKSLRQITAESVTKFDSAKSFQQYVARLDKLQYVPLKQKKLKKKASEFIFEEIIIVAAKRAVSGTQIASAGIKNIFDMQQSVPGLTVGSTNGEQITNVQELGVDEGDIVKRYGRFLIVLRDGRLFSIDTGKSPGTLTLADRINIYSSPEHDTWYDEMLIAGNRLIITGFNYDQGASEINLLTIDQRGVFKFEATYFITSEDYYSSENYATRLVNGHLVLYTPLELSFFDAADPMEFPQIRRWTETGGFTKWLPLFGVTDLYYPIQPTLDPVVHTLSVCSLDLDIDLKCQSTGIIGPPWKEFYVTPDSAYLWMTSHFYELPYRWPTIDYCPEEYYAEEYEAMPAALYEIPLFSGEPKAIHTFGAPRNQFSFSAQSGHFYALLNWLPGECELDEAEPLKFASIPLDMFSETPSVLDSSHFTSVPRPEFWSIENRFAAEYLVYGGSEGKWEAYYDDDDVYGPTDLVILPLNAPANFVTLPIAHSAERIEVFGENAIVDGYHANSGLTFSLVEIGAQPRIADSIYVDNVLEAGIRSHAFSARVELDGSGLFGLATFFKDRLNDDFDDELPSNLHFFEVDKDLHIKVAGYLYGDSRMEDPEYECQVSCIDWYGNTRPIFMNGRIFALTSNEIIEGAIASGQIIELSRIPITTPPVHSR